MPVKPLKSADFSALSAFIRQQNPPPLLRSGRRGRKFESCRDDFLAGAPEYLNFQEFRYFLLYSSAHLPMVWRPISNIVFRCCVIPWNKIHFFCPAFCAFWKRTNIFNFLFPLANLLLKPYYHFPFSISLSICQSTSSSVCFQFSSRSIFTFFPSRKAWFSY